MKRNVASPAPWFLARLAPEVYCRRDNRMVSSCPNASRAQACRCMHEVETADSLFEATAPSDETTP